jgi:antitoxin component YwqK of YwqJK toxin-antitoxin module
MYYRLLILFTVLIPVAALSQNNDTINQSDANGLKQGYWEKRSPEGTLVYQGRFKNGNPVGEMRRYYETGELKAILFYKDNTPRVKTRFFYSDGEIAGEGSYLGNQKDSLWTQYSFYSGAITSTEMYSKGLKNGMERKYYSNGQVSEEIGWSSDIKHGIWNQYFEDGTIKLRSTYSHGAVSGPYAFFWPNGNLYIKGQFVDNKRHGTWQFFTDEGKLKSEIVYHYGEAENEDEIVKKDQEFFKMIEENIGKFEDPTIEDIIPGGRELY